jgi:hypothetical protein
VCIYISICVFLYGLEEIQSSASISPGFFGPVLLVYLAFVAGYVNVDVATVCVSVCVCVCLCLCVCVSEYVSVGAIVYVSLYVFSVCLSM